MHKCQRCGAESFGHILSMFNTQEICLDCKQREMAHPDYQKAVMAEALATKSGWLDYPGIGKPDDL
jgi:hypothetical protein